MDWAKLGELSVGLVAAALILWIVLVKAKSSNGTQKSAGLTAEEWKIEIRKAVKEVLIETTPQRHQELERLFERAFEREFLKRNEKLKALLVDAAKEVIGEWLDKRLG